jgi:phosphoribosylformylglycinamidine synthase subunit PurS
MIQAQIRIMPKASILDPQGQTVLHALASLGFERAHACRVGKFITLDFHDADQAEVEREVEQICRRLLVNPNTESWSAGYVELPDPRPEAAA